MHDSGPRGPSANVIGSPTAKIPPIFIPPQSPAEEVRRNWADLRECSGDSGASSFFGHHEDKTLIRVHDKVWLDDLPPPGPAPAAGDAAKRTRPRPRLAALASKDEVDEAGGEEKGPVMELNLALSDWMEYLLQGKLLDMDRKLDRCLDGIKHILSQQPREETLSRAEIRKLHRSYESTPPLRQREPAASSEVIAQPPGDRSEFSRTTSKASTQGLVLLNARREESSTGIRQSLASSSFSASTQLKGGVAGVGERMTARKSGLMDRTSQALMFVSSRRRQKSKWAEFAWSFLDDPESSWAANLFAQSMPFVIVASVIVTLLQTVEPEPLLGGVFAASLEVGFDVIFTAELICRFLTCPSHFEFFVDSYNVIDLLAVGLMGLRIAVGFVLDDSVPNLAKQILLCVVPIVRLLKSLRRFQKFHLLLGAFELALEALPILLLFFFLIALFFSSIIYFIEPNINSLPRAMWLVIVTMTTVGYGDVTPDTDEGYVTVVILVVVSMLYMAMPIGIVGQAFNQVWKERDRILLTKVTRSRMAQWGYSAADIPVLFNLFDSDADGELNLQEFCRMINEMKIGLKGDRLILLFEFFDRDNSGTIAAEEFVRRLFPKDYYKMFGGELERTGRGSTNFAEAISASEPTMSVERL